MLRFSEEMVLLVLDSTSGRFADVPTLWFRYALAAGVLMDLALEGRIDTDPEKLVVIDSSPLGDDLLDPYLARIVRSSRPRDSHYWIEDTLKFASVIQERSLQRLVERGMLRQEDSRFLWVIQTRRYPVTDNRPVREVKRRITEVLFSAGIPDVRDIVLITLAHVCGIFEGLLSDRELKSAAGRIEQIRKMELICRDVVKVTDRRIREIKATERPARTGNA